MKKTLIILIVLLACVLVLFAVGVGVGLSRGEDKAQAKPDESSLSGLADLFGGRKALDLGDVKIASGPAGANAQPGVFRVQNQLTLSIAERSTPMRLGRLTVVEGGCAVTIVPRDERSLRVDKVLDAGDDPLELNIPGKGADISLAAQGQPATVRIDPVKP